MNDFINRNKTTYQKTADVPQELIAKYKGIAPEELIFIWQEMGFGIFEDGFLQLINPDEFDFAFQYIDKMLEPTIIWGMTALGDLLLWEGNQNWTIAPDEGNRCKLINVRKCTDNVITTFEDTVTIFMKHFLADKDYFDAKPYLEIKDQLPKLQYGQCYGYVPALALGGTRSNKNLQIVDAKSYIDIIGQAVGKIYGLD